MQTKYSSPPLYFSGMVCSFGYLARNTFSLYTIKICYTSFFSPYPLTWSLIQTPIHPVTRHKMRYDEFQLYQCLHLENVFKSYTSAYLKPRETPLLCISNCYCCIIATLFFRTLSYSKMMRYVLELWELELMLMIS